MDPKPVADSRSVLAHWMGVTDANGAGSIHGGTIMNLVDEAAGLAAMKIRPPAGGDGEHRPDGPPTPPT